MFDGDVVRRGDGGSAKLGVVLFAVIALMSFGVGLTLAAPPFTSTIDEPVAVDELTATASGTAESPSNADHHMVIDWGDGNQDVLPDFAGDAPWTWGPLQHTYAAAGTYTITATLIHSQNSGNDQGSASDTAQVTVGGPCTEDCGTDDGTTDDGGSTDDGNADGGSTPPTEVEGTVVVKKPARLAQTGPEDSTAITVIGLMVLLAGATIRLVTTGPVPDAASATSANAHLVGAARRRGSRDHTCDN